ncbi:GNAT family N-acetyltransferase [Lentisphaerota bacterium ZTH]|nr:GNAT family N-acetyltransferase [Lentisphaerota bacterium]WET05905.1 GNAT family N-acetyltransferase [Lentisphaerota bacterium ZTH]
MKYTQHGTAAEFLSRMASIFEQTEAVNGLMYGICLQLQKNISKYGSRPLFAIIEDSSGIHLAALMTPPYKLVLCAVGDVSSKCIDTLIHGLLEHSWHVPAVLAEKQIAEMFAQAWTRFQDCRRREGKAQAFHELRTVQAVKYAPGKIIRAAADNLDTVQVWAREFHKDCFGDENTDTSSRLVEQYISTGDLFFWFDSMPVAMAAKARPTPHGESICFVYTPPECRGRGYATSLVASLSQKILDSGKQFCCLATDLANTTSNGIYRKIGYVPVAKVIDIHFDDKLD